MGGSHVTEESKANLQPKICLANTILSCHEGK